MNVRCWNCGNDQEISFSDEIERVKSSIVGRLQSLSDTYAKIGYTSKFEAVQEAVNFVRSFRP